MSRISELVEKHSKLRAEGLNLVASENLIPAAAAAALSSDLQARYHSAWYGGTRIVREIIERTEALARELFGARHALVSPVSGNLCDLAALLAFTAPGDDVAILPFRAGGYPLNFAAFGRNRIDLDVREGSFDPAPETTSFRRPPALLIAGASYIPFPHPVRELRRLCGRVVYDGSHVMGLIACSLFQDPLREGAEVLLGSTHKSLPGPQGGLALTDSDEAAAALRAVLDLDLEKGIALVDNLHPARVAALGIALEALLADRGYGARVVANAKALAAGLAENGVPVKFADRGFTESHQVFLDLDSARAAAFCAALENRGIFIDVAGRMGTAEATSRGLDEGDLRRVAKTMAAEFLKGRF